MPPPPQVAPPVHEPQSSVAPQPSPMTPQKLPPGSAHEIGTHPGFTHTPLWHVCPLGHVPQSSARPHPSPTAPQKVEPCAEQVAAVQFTSPTQMLFSQVQPFVQPPQSSVAPQPLPIIPQ
jgi:hypothetical protein